jgi:DNA-binding response OmpR family regulator
MHTTILLLEPDHDLNRLFLSVLQAEGYHVHALHRWEDAQLVLNASIPDLIIFDWVSTATGGYQWLNGLQQEQVTAGIPVLLLCNHMPPSTDVAWSAIVNSTISENAIDVDILRQQVRTVLAPRTREVGTSLV